MRILIIVLAATLAVQPLERGKEHFRAGRYADAIEDLRAAAAAALTPEAREKYVTTGKIETLAELEESLVYLALAYDRIGREAEARDAVTRLLNAERIAPTFATLPLSTDAAPFEPLAARLVPSIPLVANQKLATNRGMVVQPTLAQQRAEMMNLIEERVAAARAEIEKSANERIAQERAAAQKLADERVATETASAMKAAEEKIAAERDVARAAAMKSAEERIEAERAAAEKIAEERIAQERAAAMKNAEDRIASERAAVERETASKIAAARAEAERVAEEKIATERAAMARLSEERIAVERASAEKEAQERIAAAETERRRALLMSLREAETLAIAGQLDEANRIYVSLAQSPTSTREAIAAAAAGLYRTGGFAEAVRAFTRLGNFARGEDDLRYYFAVSLYEIGKYADAKRELAIALPNLQRTEDVERYRVRIEQAR
ncbi:MAG TPA: hypothetical protein VEK79_17430 [Thermoanaerobaculia bacterium]|nr:hypothetical protein [Thermoanaerobaculia bacterium]